MTDINTVHIAEIEEKLKNSGFTISILNKSLMTDKLPEIMDLVNGVRLEYSSKYCWTEEKPEYFLKDIPGKWKYSFAVFDKSGKICMVSINSLYDTSIHFHAVYTGKKFRSLNLTKFVLLKTADAALKNSIPKLELYCQKNNTSAIILYLKTGFEINSIRNNKDILLTADPISVFENCLRMIDNSEAGR